MLPSTDQPFTKLKATIIFLLMLSLGYSQSLDSLDSYVQNEMLKRQIPGLSLAILKDGILIHKKSHGFSVVEHEVPAKDYTIYPLASLTKQFIAAGILLLEQDGSLNLDAPIKHYLDSLPKKWQKLSLRQLLTHTAGLAPMEMEWKSLKINGWPKHVTRKMLWDSAVEDTVPNLPGEHFAYHNVGYSLAVFIIEAITNADHRFFFKHRLFEPLGMRNTFFEDQTKVTPHQAEGYTLKDGQLAKIWRVGQEDIGVGDGLYSNLEDMIKWVQALNQHRLLTPQQQDKMFTKAILNNGESFHYGLGWWLPERNGIPYRYHNGITGPEILSISKIGLDIIVLSNFGQGEFDEVRYWGLAQDIAGKFFLEDFQHRPVADKIPVPEPHRYVGSFAYESEGTLDIYLKEGHLYLKDSYGEAKMIYLGNNAFTLQDDSVIFRFLDFDKIRVEEEFWNYDHALRIKQ
ncbi:serine hydrolase domain-containing protein [Flagellimonas flava]|uniref:serine hydrolase domain-containing protein n=1 Tax=Flagellimonas flava TaxID=570519 RepID=UPI003D65178A